MRREDFCDRAKEIITVDRQNQYGEVEDNFQVIADLWSVWRNDTFTKEDVAIMMILLKVARLKHKMKADSFLDLIGYAALCGELSGVEEMKK